ncbi:hypothetical protein NEILACOT_05107 [Neisseria lactamica ATCC 23970]|uniref:Uncharacterized protein n=1 Tax=Neisseria lactamica ATCC 23970 TaxID=546265 RepID=D0WC28_NEILA|nr:hypothetical protein NEILACOT_05107 [Neisseria lactamica ATCC 23970]
MCGFLTGTGGQECPPFFCSDAFEYPFDSVRLQGGISVRAEINSVK